ncbi:MAG: hypothetical protein ACLQDF_02080 [Desulfomonilia bacterium]
MKRGTKASHETKVRGGTTLCKAVSIMESPVSQIKKMGIFCQMKSIMGSVIA